MRYLFCLCLLTLLWSCETQQINRLCEDGTATPITYTRFEFSDYIDSTCLQVIHEFSTAPDPSSSFRDHWLIQDEASYDSLNTLVQAEFEFRKGEAGRYPFDCDTLVLPSIDFSQHALLFVEMTTTGCEPLEQKIEVVRCDETQTYQVLLEWPYKGGCEPLYVDRVWLLLPKLEAGYTLEIQDET